MTRNPIIVSQYPIPLSPPRVDELKPFIKCPVAGNKPTSKENRRVKQTDRKKNRQTKYPILSIRKFYSTKLKT